MKVENQLQASDAVSLVRDKEDAVAKMMLTNIMNAIREASNNAVMSMTYDEHPNPEVAERVEKHLEALGYKVRQDSTSQPYHRILLVSWSK